MRVGGVLPHPVPQPAHPVRQASAAPALPAHCVRLCDRTVILRQAGGQDADRDPDQGHAPLRQHVPVAQPRAAGNVYLPMYVDNPLGLKTAIKQKDSVNISVLDEPTNFQPQAQNCKSDQQK